MKRNFLVLASWFAVAALCSLAPCQGAPNSAEARIRGVAARLANYRSLLESPDPNLRLAALSEMLVASDPALRELAFKLGFASPDSEMRSLALRQRLLYAKFLVIELERDPAMTEQQWTSSIGPYAGSKISIPSLTLDPVSGELKSGSTQIGRLAGEELDLRTHGAVGKLRLGPNATMTGRLSYSPQISHAIRLVLQ